MESKRPFLSKIASILSKEQNRERGLLSSPLKGCKRLVLKKGLYQILPNPSRKKTSKKTITTTTTTTTNKKSMNKVKKTLVIVFLLFSSSSHSK